MELDDPQQIERSLVFVKVTTKNGDKIEFGKVLSGVYVRDNAISNNYRAVSVESAIKNQSQVCSLSVTSLSMIGYCWSTEQIKHITYSNGLAML